MSDLHVIFGTGPLGKWTARELLQMGHRVRLVNRSGRAQNLPKSVEVVQGDAYDLERNTVLTQGIGLDEAKKQVRQIADWVQTLGNPTLNIDHQADAYELKFEWKFGQQK